MERFAIKIDERVKLSLYNICRLCGIDNRDQVPIIDEPDATFVVDDEPSLCKKIIDCVGIQVQATDKMPQKICTLCVDKINDFYEYREMCKATNIQTRELLGLPPEIKDEKSLIDLLPQPQQPFVEIPTGNVKRKRKLKSECINYEEIDDDEIDEKPPKKKFPKNSVGAKSKKLLASRKIVVKRESVKPIPSRVLPIREKAIPVFKDKSIIPPFKEKSATVKDKNLIVKEKTQLMKDKVTPHLVKGKGQLSKDKLHSSKEKLSGPTIKIHGKDKVQMEKEKLKSLKDKNIPMNSKLLSFKEDKTESSSGKIDTELITLKTPNRRERQRELETKKKRKIQTLQPLDKVKTENLYACIVCPKDFKTQPEYDIHFFREHTPNTLEHGCSACREAFYDLQEYRDHQLWHRLSSIPFSCFKCDSNFDRITAYTRHFLTSCVPHIEYNILDDIKCSTCHKTFVTKNLYEWHGCIIKNNSKCPRCNKFFAKRLNLQRHVVVCNDKIVENQSTIDEASSSRSDTVEVEAIPSNDGSKIVKIEPGSILEIENETHVDVPINNDDDDVHEMEDSVEDDVGFQDDPDEEIDDTSSANNETPINASSEINSLTNLEKDRSDIVSISDNTETIAIRPIKQEKVDRRYDEVICRGSTANIPMVQIKQEILNSDYSDHVDINILRNIKPEPVDSIPEPNSSKDICSATASDCPNQTNKVATPKPTLKLKIKKEHGTLNSSFIDSDLGEGGDSSPNPHRSNDDESSTPGHHRKKRNKHKKKIYKIPKQLALIIKQEKLSRDECETLVTTEDSMESSITVPVISEVTSIAENVLEPTNTLNQMEYFEEEDDTNLTVCYPGNSREVAGHQESSEPQNDIQIPVIAEVVSLTQSEPVLPLISSVTSLSQASGIRVKMEFSNFASPRPNSCETVRDPNSRIEQDDMITGNYHTEYDTVRNIEDQLEQTDSEEITLATSKGSVESDIEVKPNLKEFVELSEHSSQKNNESAEPLLILEQVSSTDITANIINSSNNSPENISSKSVSQLTANITEANEILSPHENQPPALCIDGISEDDVTENQINKNDSQSIENLDSKEEIVLAETDPNITQNILDIPPIVQTSTEGNSEFNTETYVKASLQPELIDTKEPTTEELESNTSNDVVVNYYPQTDYPDVNISIIQENLDCGEPTATTVVHKLDIEQDYKNIEPSSSGIANESDEVSDSSNPSSINTNISPVVENENIESSELSYSVIHKLDTEQQESIENLNKKEAMEEEDVNIQIKEIVPNIEVSNDESRTENINAGESVVQENLSSDELHSTDMHKFDVEHFENNENVNLVDASTTNSFSTIAHNDYNESRQLDLLKPHENLQTVEFVSHNLDCGSTNETPQNVEEGDISSEPRETDEESHSTSFQNIRIDLVNDTEENESSGLVLSAEANLPVKATKRCLEIDVNTEETNRKIKKISEDSFDVEESLDVHVNHVMDETIHRTPDCSVVHSEDTVSETKQADEVNIESYSNPTLNENPDYDREQNTDSSSADIMDIDEEQAKSNVGDLQIESTESSTKDYTNYNQTIPSDHDEDMSDGDDDPSDSDYNPIVRDEEPSDHKVTNPEIIGIHQSELSCDIIENKTNELNEIGLENSESSYLYSSSKDETDKPMQSDTSSGNTEEESVDVALKYATHFDEDNQINNTTVLEPSKSEEESSSAFQNETNINMEELPKIIPTPVEVQEDLNHSETEFKSQYIEEDAFSRFHQHSNFTVQDHELPTTDFNNREYIEHLSRKNEEFNQIPDENEISMKNKESEIVYQPPRDEIPYNEFSDDSFESNSDLISSIVEDHSNKIKDTTDINKNEEELSIVSDDVALALHSHDEVSNRECNFRMIDNSYSKIQHTSNIVATQYEENISYKIQSECDNSLIKKEDSIPNLEELRNYDEEKTKPEEEMRCTELASELDDISDDSLESQVEELLPEKTPEENKESYCNSMMEEENIVLDNSRIENTKESENVYKTNPGCSGFDTTINESLKQAEISCDAMKVDPNSESLQNTDQVIVDSLQCAVASKDDIDQIQSIALDASQTQVDTISEKGVEFEISTIATNPENIQSISSKPILEHTNYTSHESFADNLANTSSSNIDTTQKNRTDSIIYKTADIEEEEIDSDLEKELLEEMHDESVK